MWSGVLSPLDCWVSWMSLKFLQFNSMDRNWRRINSHVVILILLLCSRFYRARSWGWLFSPDYDDDDNFDSKRTSSTPDEYQNPYGSEFDIEALDNIKGKQLVERASKDKGLLSNSCWQKAYGQLFSSCKHIMQDEEKKSRLAWYMSDCFQRESGRRPLPQCPTSTLMVNCLKGLDDSAHQVYLAFFIDANAMCHHLQSHAFKQDTERVVNELKSSTHWVVDKLDKIEQQSDSLLEHSNEIHNSLDSIESQAELLAQKSKVVEDKITNVIDQSNSIFEQSHQIIGTQSKLQEQQFDMQKTLDTSMADLQNSYVRLGEDIGFLQTLTSQTQKQISEVAGTVSSQLDNLQSKADDIGNVVTLSLGQQKQLLDGQSLALQGLDTLTQTQTEAFEQSRLSVQQLADNARQHQHEFTMYQEKLQATHNRLAQSSSAILSAQEAFESKQATMFMALDKLFSLHNAILLESRAIKTIFFYLITMCVLYMLTSTKQTNNVRSVLYFGLCISFAIEFFIARFKGSDLSQQGWIASKTFYVRTTFVSIAILHLIFSFIRYRDYEQLNYKMLLEIQEKMKTLESNLDGNQGAVDVYHKGCKLLEMDSKVGQQLHARNIVKRALIFQRQRSKVGGFHGQSYMSWLDNLPEEDSSDDPDYELPSCVK